MCQKSVSSGTKFIILTDRSGTTENIRQALQELYSRIFYNYVVRHASWIKTTQLTEETCNNDQKIDTDKCVTYLNQTFVDKTEEYMKGLPFYNKNN